MMYGTEQSDSPIVPKKPVNKAAQAVAEPAEGSGGGKRWDQEECGLAKHGPDPEPGRRVTGARTHT